MLFINDKWVQSRFSKEVVGKNAVKIVTSRQFWDDIVFVVDVLGPLVKVVRLVDTERKPTMGYIYEKMRQAREQVVDRRWKQQLNHPLHEAAYYLNPKFLYSIPPEEIDSHPKYAALKKGLYKAMKTLIPTEEERYQAKLELRSYSDCIGELGCSTTIKGRDNLQPHDWWLLNGGIDVPNLQKFAIRVLSQTCGASPCERNWSSFNHIHSKKRNHFLQQKLNDSVYIQYNKKLQRRYNLDHRYKVGAVTKPIFLDESDEDDEWLDPSNVDELYTLGADVLTLEEVRDVMAVDSGPVTRRSAAAYAAAARVVRRPHEEEEDDEDVAYENVGLGNIGIRPTEEDEIEGFEFDLE
ncbi:hypothetical protein MKW94_010140 [Papaver nudicaule]|uniref:HAT C-terminal dimerisation domain-containing protein n=1 Tax=Papaver nudicaule TaxID=74823 RepID=A0AA42AZE4_PAPNU|nr:hypothetical protein [Papaver nudicaule]